MTKFVTQSGAFVTPILCGYISDNNFKQCIYYHDACHNIYIYTTNIKKFISLTAQIFQVKSTYVNNDQFWKTTFTIYRLNT